MLLMLFSKETSSKEDSMKPTTTSLLRTPDILGPLNPSTLQEKLSGTHSTKKTSLKQPERLLIRKKEMITRLKSIVSMVSSTLPTLLLTMSRVISIMPIKTLLMKERSIKMLSVKSLEEKTKPSLINFNG